MNFIIGKKYPMRNGEEAEYLGYETETEEAFFGLPLTFRGRDRVRMAHADDGRASLSIETQYDIISDTPIEEIPSGGFSDEYAQRTQTPMVEAAKRWNGIEIFYTGKDLEERNVYRTRGDLFNLLEDPYPRRKFDVSKCGNPEDHYNLSKSEKYYHKALYGTRREVLEAWNEGRIEELLQEWTK